MAELKDFAEEWHNDRDYIVAHTSGSTGIPKEIRLFKKDMLASARSTNKRFGITSSSVIAAPLSIDYIAGKMMYVRAEEAGCRFIQMPVSTKLNISTHIDLLAIVPSQVPALLNQPEAAKLIRNIIIGGAPLSTQLQKALIDNGFNAFITYGMTETCSHVALARPSTNEAVFEAMPGISFETDDRGCLVISAPEFSFGRLSTNDLVQLHDPAHFIWIGRYDNIINSGGIKISPEKLEHDIAKTLVIPFYVTSIPDDKWGEVPVIVYEGEQSDEQTVLSLVRSEIDHKLCPKRAYAVNALPKTPNGKLLREKPV